MRILKYALKNIIRNPFLSLSSIFVIGLLLFFVNILIFVLFVSENFITDVQSKIKFTINYQSGYALDSLKSQVMIDGLRSTFSGIVVTPISKDEAYARNKALYPDLISIIEWSGENPFPDSLSISGIPLDRYDEFNNYILEHRDLFHYDEDILGKKLLDYKSQFRRITTIVTSLRVFEYGVFALLGLFAFTVATIMYNVVSNSIFFHREEIEIIELVGGRSSFTYGQFLLQAIFYGLGAVVIVAVIFLLFRSSLDVSALEGSLSVFESTVVYFFDSLSWILSSELGVILLLSTLSATIALKKYTYKTMFL